ncbi:MAG: TraB/GumN family protein [Candidatus Altiarchaeota archaeon]
MPTEELVFRDKTIIIVGTAHVSDESVRAVEEAISKYKPDAVAVELCRQRYQALKEEKRWEETDILEVISSDRIHLFLLQILLANFQRKIGENVGVKPGAEMLKAVEIAEREKVNVILADRDIKVTLKRAMDMMSLKEKAKLFWGFVSGFVQGEDIDKELIERLKEKDVLTELMEDLAVETPSIKKVLVDERDEYIAHILHITDAKTVVAVVGAGHMAGIKRNLAELDGKVLVSHSMTLGGQTLVQPKKKKRISVLSLAIILAFAALLIAGLRQNGGTMTADMLVKWFVLTGAISAVGPILAMGHPFSVLAAFVSAPLKFLHPTIATGWIAGFIELKMRKPRVVDFKNLMMLKTTADYFRNRVVRLLFVVAFTNVTATVGNIVGLMYLATLVAGG